MAYDREAVKALINEELAASVDGSGPAITLFAWRKCGFATKARKSLAESDVDFADVVLDKYSPMHAELAMTTGRLSVPYAFEKGELIGGTEPDGELPGVVGWLREREAAADSA